MGKEEEIESGSEPDRQIQKNAPEASELVWVVLRERHTKQNWKDVRVVQSQLPKHFTPFATKTREESE